MIDNIEEAPIVYDIDLNLGQMNGVKINSSAIKEIIFTDNEMFIIVG